MRHRFVVLACVVLTASLFARVPQVPTEQPALPQGPELQEPVAPEVVREDVPGHPDVEGSQGAVRGEGAADEGANLVLRTPDGMEHMRITSAGNVGVGTTGPSTKLTVFNNASGTRAFLAQQDSTITADVSLSEVSSLGWQFSRVSEGVTQSGAAHALRGVSHLFDKGTLVNAYGLSTEVGHSPGAANTGTIQNAFGLYSAVRKNDGTIVNGFGLYIPDVIATNDFGIYQTGTDDSNYLAGKTTVGAANPQQPYPVLLDVRGNVTVLGSITGATVIGATYQDLAEWVPSNSDLSPGTVVVLDPALGNGVMASSASYDTAVAGVVSAQPGIILGEAGAAKEQIATTGRVRVRVDASAAPIRVGDLLVTSDKPGMAMRSEPMDIGGRKFHQPGTIIGKALQALEGGEGEILVLLSLQ